MMKKTNETKFVSFLLLPIIFGLIFTMLINGWHFLTGDAAIQGKFLNILNNPPITVFPGYFSALLSVTGLLELLGALLLILGLVRRELFHIKSAVLLKWGILTCLFAVTVFGFMTRVISNHAGSANLYFYVTLLYGILYCLESQYTGKSTGIFNVLKLIPIYLTVGYTLGFPGWQKLVNTSAVMGKYVGMFSNTFLAKFPGGIPPFIYFLGFLELAVPIMLLGSLLKGEFMSKGKGPLLNVALLVSSTTFIMLAFGLSILLNYPGSTNLIFYAIQTLAMFLYVRYSQNNTNVATDDKEAVDHI